MDLAFDAASSRIHKQNESLKRKAQKDAALKQRLEQKKRLLAKKQEEMVFIYLDY